MTEIAGGGHVQNEPEHGLEAEGREPDPFEEAICREWLEHMDKKGLSQEAQLIWEGYHYHEIAERLGITESKARRTITSGSQANGNLLRTGRKLEIPAHAAATWALTLGELSTLRSPE